MRKIYPRPIALRERTYSVPKRDYAPKLDSKQRAERLKLIYKLLKQYKVRVVANKVGVGVGVIYKAIKNRPR